MERGFYGGMSAIVSAEEAARRIGCRPQLVRERLKKGLWDIGKAFSPEQTGKKTWTYEINEAKLERFLRGV